MSKIKKEKGEWLPVSVNILAISIGLLLTLSLIGIYFINFQDYSLSPKPDDWGVFGDYIGGTLNPVFAFVNFVLLLSTLDIQRKTFQSTKQELEETKKANQDSAKALKEQSEAIKLQNFENTFFNMLKLHNEIMESINIVKAKSIKKYPFDFNRTHQNQANTTLKNGREAIKFLYDEIDAFGKQHNDISKFNKTYDIWHVEYQEHIGHYFSNIYQILKFISTSSFNKEKKQQYANILRSQFSLTELKLLFYHGTGKIASRKFKKLLEEFEFFEHLVIESNNNFKFILSSNIYDLNVFGNNKQEIEKFINEENEKINNRINSYEKSIEQGYIKNNLFILTKMYFDKKEYKKARDSAEAYSKFLNKEIEKYIDVDSSIVTSLEEEINKVDFLIKQIKEEETIIN